MKALNIVLAIAAFAAVLATGAQGRAERKSVCDTPERHQFDFALGRWDVFDANGVRDGSNDITLEYGGCVIVEHWTGADGDDGSSFTSYAPKLKQWEQTWIDNEGRTLRWAGSLQNGSIVLSAYNVNRKGITVFDRLIWTPLPGSRVRQHLEESLDSGLHWRQVFDGYYRRKNS